MNDPQQPRLIPLDGWGTEVANILDGGDYDAELGLRTIRDAIRVSNSGLSDEALHEEYCEAAVTEFDEDARPTEPGEFDE